MYSTLIIVPAEILHVQQKERTVLSRGQGDPTV